MSDTPLNWGHKYEPLSTLLYEYYNDVCVEEFGCIPHSNHSFIGASPDGIVMNVLDEDNLDQMLNYGVMIEIKNPFRALPY